MPGEQIRRGGQMTVVVRRLGIHDPDDEIEFWLSRPAGERIAAVETMRRRVYEISDASGSRLSRVCRVVHRS
jgi:hypothetical protein